MKCQYEGSSTLFVNQVMMHKPSNSNDDREEIRLSQEEEKLIHTVRSIFNIEKFYDFHCYGDSVKVGQKIMLMTFKHQLHNFLVIFGHSLSCSDPSCSNTCLMFRRIQHHVSTASHPCALMHVYTQLMQLHIDTCTANDCGLVTCKSMYAIRQIHGAAVLPRNFEQIEKDLARSYSQLSAFKTEPASSLADG